MVIMMMEITGSPIMGLSTKRSIDRARITEKAMLIKKPAQNGTWYVVRRATHT